MYLVQGSSCFETKRDTCMVAERRYRSAGRCSKVAVVTSPVSSRIAMTAPMLRGAAASVDGSAMLRSASIGIMAVSAEGESAIQGARARGWCDRRRDASVVRGRQPVDIEDNAIDTQVEAASTQSAISVTDLEQNYLAGTTTAIITTTTHKVRPIGNTNAAKTMQKEDKVAEMIGKWEKEHQRLANETKQQTDLAQNMAEMIDQMNKKIKKMEREAIDLQTHRDVDIEKAEIALENTCNNRMINNMEKMAEGKHAKIRLLEYQLAKYR